MEKNDAMMTDVSTLFAHPVGCLPFEPEAVVLANGDFPVHPYPQALLRDAPCVVCCDGAAEAYLATGRVPDAIVGDGDSLSPEHRLRHAARVYDVPDQDTNDLTKSILFLQRRGVRRVALLGATGRREDHALGNIALLLEHAPRFEALGMVTDFGVFLPACGTQTFASCAGQQVSVFSFGARAVRSEGLRYPLYDFTRLWEGTLNEAQSTSFTIHAEGHYLVYLAYDVKA